MKSLGVNNKRLCLFIRSTMIISTSVSATFPMLTEASLADVHTYEIMNADVMVLTESAAKIFSEADAEVAG
jgi:large subunit ribosomal protein L4